MDVSRIKKNDLKVWLPLFDDVEILCRYLPQSAFDKISAQTSAVKFDPKSHRSIPERDEKKFRSLLGRAVVEDWRGLTDAGEPLPCTPENIDWLMEELTEFRLLVLDAPLSLEKMVASERAIQEKNSLTTSEPGPTSPA
ncbi:hypothetical protein DBW_1861 [Desulfuromonas sp. DDH964]|uniref:hypothetical protein n=1 Tax=Desulfuromonas sp. DDH964 TaxID=1823759 RepID=UPI00078CA846|nr:hypothetical protein [Desulfuromonas sp. DDH964]AMV72215.1 hypothetical protein DBW_1861 [Desulfuromonas sp. DDH964]